ncbi:Chitinase [Clostridium cavendishii DSM 21758]|uniref:chitinase n=1 Tax=Clostridium cavendishii DSM 21758 TaxID=1121302 RepID=A0A1M6D8D0_9CLOT|nr:glycosyl hydrolase family 18 protein [Clostridium cavendishii]SHI69443.1 Chitinase [Clostridium cavendishii DSM 21758]
MSKKFKTLASIFTTLILIFTLIPATVAKAGTNLGQKLLVGYWHNFDNGTGIIKLRDVSPKWDVINVSFGETGGDRATVEFTPCYGTEEGFKADIAYLKSQGKKVNLSIGGQNGVVLVPDAQSRDKFVNSLKTLIDKYGFDGIDIDLESGISLEGNDNDFKNPKTPQIVNLISAIRTLADSYGPNFIVSMAPEIAYVQGGINSYGNIWGAYLPIIYGVRDKLTYIHVQHYNAGGNMGLDGVTYNQGTADFEVAMADMLLNGFPIGGNTSNMFPALREDQVMIGIPASTGAAGGGYINPTEMKKALDYITKGIPYGGKYKLSKEGGYPGFRGLMTWSINWDAKNNFEFSNSYSDYFANGVKPPVNTLKAASLTASNVDNGNFSLTAVVPRNNTASSYTIYEESSAVATGTLQANSTSDFTIIKNISNKNPGTYNYTVEVSDGQNKLISNKVTVVVKDTIPVTPTLKAATLKVDNVNGGNYNLSWMVPANNSAVSYKLFEGITEIEKGNLTLNNSSDVSLTKSITNKAPGSYDYTVTLYDAANKSVVSNKVTVTVSDKPAVTPWAEYVNYKVGDKVSYSGKTYECIQPHQSLPGWDPASVAALWRLV